MTTAFPSPSATRFAVSGRRVIHEVVAGEALVIDLTSGHYYALNEAGSALWSLLVGRRTIESMGQWLARGLAVSRADAMATVVTFLARLEDEGLIVPTDDAGPGADEAMGAEDLAVSSPPPLAIPDFERYTDMEDLLLADPVHELDLTEAGAGPPDV